MRVCVCVCLHVLWGLLQGFSVLRFPVRGLTHVGTFVLSPLKPLLGGSQTQPVGAGRAVFQSPLGGGLLSHWDPSCVGCFLEPPACTGPGSSPVPVEAEGLFVGPGQSLPGRGLPEFPPQGVSGL